MKTDEGHTCNALCACYGEDTMDNLPLSSSQDGLDAGKNREVWSGSGVWPQSSSPDSVFWQGIVIEKTFLVQFSKTKHV